MYLLDTNHCSRAILKDSKVLSRLNAIDRNLVATSVISQGELIDMVERSTHKETNLTLVRNFLQNIYIYNIDQTTAALYGKIKATLFKQFAPKEKTKRRKTKIIDLGFDDNDLWIAAIASQHNLIVVSADSDFRRIEQVTNLSAESWL